MPLHWNRRPRTGPGARTLAPALVLAAAIAATACSTTPGDPLEPMNRRVHAFNEGFDRVIARPVATGYRNVTPRPVSRGVSNFFGNLDDVVVLVNSAAQLKGGDTAATAYRLILNTTVGLYGLIDVAEITGQRKRNEDFGQTLGAWGVPSGPYLVLPLLGPSNFRDAPARYVDGRTNPMYRIDDVRTRYGLTVLRAIDTRAALLGASDLFETAATDRYAYMRDAWSTRRANRVHDGNPPPGAVPDYEDEDFDPFDDEGDEDLFD